MAGQIIVDTRDGIEVKARRRLEATGAFDNFMDNFMKSMNQKLEKGDDVIIADLDLSQNKLDSTQWTELMNLLSSLRPRVLRFRLFGCPTLDDEVLRQLADYFGEMKEKETTLEMHLSDCAITTDGFLYFMSKIEELDCYPIQPTVPGRGKPMALYLRLENNYIDEKAIKEKIDCGVIKSFTKREGRGGGDQGAKVNLLVVDGKSFQQRTGTPPAPENAPAPKTVIDRSSDAGQRSNNFGSNWHPSSATSWSGNSNAWPQKNQATTSWVQRPQSANWSQKPQTAAWQKTAHQGQAKQWPALTGQAGHAGAHRGAYDRSRTPMNRNSSGATNGAGGRVATAGGKIAGKAARSDLPYPWEEHFSDEYKIPYFWNSETGQSLWEKPKA